MVRVRVNPNPSPNPNGARDSRDPLCTPRGRRVAAAVEAVRWARLSLAQPLFYGMQIARRKSMAQLWQQHGELLSLATDPERLLDSDDVRSQQLLDDVQDGLIKLGSKLG